MNVLERIYIKSCSAVFFLWNVEELLFLKSAVMALKFSKGRKLVQSRNQKWKCISAFWLAKICIIKPLIGRRFIIKNNLKIRLGSSAVNGKILLKSSASLIPEILT